MQSIYVKTYFPKQRSVALTAAVALGLTLLYLLSGSTQASGATVGTGSCVQTVGSSTGVSVAVVGNNCVITFTNVGTTTWTVPAGVGSVRVLVVGAGGGNGGGGCNWMWPRGGGGGAVVDAATNVTAGDTVPVTVGGGGVAGVQRDCAGPAGLISSGTQGGSSQFATMAAVSGGYSSPVGTSAGGASGNGNVASGGNNSATTMSSFAGGGGGGAGGPGGQESGGNNTWVNSDKAGRGGIGVFSDITGSSIGHGGGGAGHAAAGAGTSTSGGGNSTTAANSGGSYGGGGGASLPTSGGSGVVIISYDPTCPLDSGYTNCQLFSYTGSNQSFTFPSNINGAQEILVEVWGAGGGGSGLYWSGDQGGAAGGFTKSRISGTANEALTVVVGQGGLIVDTTVQYGGGGPGGTGSATAMGSSGGGYSGVFSGAGTTTPVLISGGGGGGSPGSTLAASAGPGGGGGANQNGGAGSNAQISGRGGTSSAGGAGANTSETCVTTGSVSTTGSSLLGGSGCGQSAASTAGTTEGGGGGGGGYFGGGGGLFQLPDGAIQNGGGGGGSGYLNLARGTVITNVTGQSADSVANNFSLPDTTSIRYANNAGRGGRENTATTADNSGGNGYITIQWKTAAFISSVPNAPTIGTATTTGGTTATVAFTAPASNGGATINSYTATSSPAGGTGTLTQAGSGTISVTGLAPGTAYTFTVTAANSIGSSAPSAASNSITTTYISTIALPESTLVSASATTNITGLSVGGLATGSTYLIAIAINNGPSGAVLKLPTTTGLTARTGFSTGSNTFTSFTTISFTGLLASVNTAIAALQYISGSTTGSPLIKVTASSFDSNYALNGYNGHFYISNTTAGLSNANYTDARATAKLQTYRGMSGYLTTITSSGENDFISSNIANASNIWIGATDELIEGVWRWDTSGGSPEAGTQFWQGLGTANGGGGSVMNSNYNSWSSGEPNEYTSSNNAGEDYAVTNWNGAMGYWNDCNNNGCLLGTLRYVIEFGTNAADAGFVNSSSNLSTESFSLFYSTSGQLPTVLTVDPQSSSRFLPMTLNTTGPTNLLFCLNETDSSGNNLGSPTINFDVAANGSATTAGNGSSAIVGDRSTAAYIYGNGANVISTLNSVSGIQIYLASGNFNSTTGASKYIRVRAISIAASSGIGSKTCASTPYTSQIIEIRPLGLTRIMKKGTITLRN